MTISLAQERSLANILNELLLRHSLSISEFARKIKLPQPTIHRISRGQHIRPHRRTLELIANYFHITIEQLCGFEPIPFLKVDRAQNIPILTIKELSCADFQTSTFKKYLSSDIPISKNGFATQMPDSSMEPIIPYGSLLIIDPDKTPAYKSFVIVRLENYETPLIRQLIVDATRSYLKAISSDHSSCSLTQLKPHDSIIGVIIQIRFNLDRQ